MNRTHTDEITIGRNPVLSQTLAILIHNRKVRERRAARRREKLSRFCRNVIDTLRFWK